MLSSIVVIASLGLLVSVYACFVEQKIKQDHSYKPACDISERISCSKPLASKYSNVVFGTSNSLIGILLYATVVVMGFLGLSKLIFFTAIIACCLSILFAYILLTKVQTLCLVCLSIYAINGLLLWVSWPS